MWAQALDTTALSMAQGSGINRRRTVEIRR